MLTKFEMQTWLRSIWTDVRGASLKNGHPAPYPVEIAERLIKLFSFAGDTILDPFGGTGSTAIAALNAGRNSISLDIEPSYVAVAKENIQKAIKQPRKTCAVHAELILGPQKRNPGLHFSYRLLDTFRDLLLDKEFRHRSSPQGDTVRFNFSKTSIISTVLPNTSHEWTRVCRFKHPK